MSVSLFPVGDSGVLAVFQQEISKEVSAQVFALDAAVRAAGLPGLGETVPAFASLLIRYDPLQTDYDRVAQAVSSLAEGPAPASAGAGRHYEHFVGPSAALGRHRRVAVASAERHDGSQGAQQRAHQAPASASFFAVLSSPQAAYMSWPRLALIVVNSP